MSLQELLLDPLAPAFMVRAMLAVIMIGAVSGVVGAYVVTRGMAFLGDALAHSILPGVAIAFLTTGGDSGSLLWGGIAAGVLSALGIGFLTRRERLSQDTAIGIVFAGMLALGIGIISRTQNFAVDLSHILIGNVLAVSPDDLTRILVIGAVVLAIIFLFYKEFLLASFDPTLVQTLRLPGEAPAVGAAGAAGDHHCDRCPSGRGSAGGGHACHPGGHCTIFRPPPAHYDALGGAGWGIEWCHRPVSVVASAGCPQRGYRPHHDRAIPAGLFLRTRQRLPLVMAWPLRPGRLIGILFQRTP